MIEFALPGSELRVLCLGAHPDDVEIGCGATLLALAASRTVTAKVVVLTGSGERIAEARSSTARFLPGAEVSTSVLGLADGRLPAHWGEVKQALEDSAAEFTPDVIFCPGPQDAHQDHRLVAELVPTVWRDSLVLHYEIPKWDGDLGRPSHYVAVEESIARLKAALLDECFPSQKGRDWWGGDTFLGLMRLRGIECRAPYAEAFHVTKARVSL